jgi:hypothetical protein
MRRILFLLLLGLSAGSVYVHTLARTSYSGLSEAQFSMAERELEKLARRKDERGLEARVELTFIEDERRRQQLAWALPAATALVGLLTLVLSVAGRRRRLSDEEVRLLGATGGEDFGTLVRKRQAADMLGVSPSAPSVVVEAALQALLASREPAQLQGLRPDLRDTLLAQREDLIRARDVLLGEARGAKSR